MSGYNKGDNQKKNKFSSGLLIKILVILSLVVLCYIYFNYKSDLGSFIDKVKSDTNTNEVILFEDKQNTEENSILRDISNVSEEDSKPYLVVDEMPSFPGGEIKMQEFIRGNLRYPEAALDSGVEGRVIVRFVVTGKGEITNITIIRSLDPDCDKEVMRVIELMPNWIPGRHKDKHVSVYFTLPVLFKTMK